SLLAHAYARRKLKPLLESHKRTNQSRPCQIFSRISRENRPPLFLEDKRPLPNLHNSNLAFQSEFRSRFIIRRRFILIKTAPNIASSFIHFHYPLSPIHFLQFTFSNSLPLSMPSCLSLSSYNDVIIYDSLHSTNETTRPIPLLSSTRSAICED